MKPITDIQELKNIQLEILSYVDIFCQKNNISYSLSGGTLLGAIRHKGYIPWDDDIDIFMLRADYDKLIKSFNDPSNNYVIHTVYNDSTYSYPFAKISNSKTLLEENLNTKSLGVHIDVFPVDNLFDTLEESEIMVKNVSRYKVLGRFKLIKPTKEEKRVKKIIFNLAKILLFPFSFRFFSIQSNKKAIKGKKDSIYVGCLVWGYGKKEILPRKIFTEYLLVDFEDRKFKIIKEYDVYLKSLFGDYMQLPPEEKRKTRHYVSKIYWK